MSVTHLQSPLTSVRGKFSAFSVSIKALRDMASCQWQPTICRFNVWSRNRSDAKCADKSQPPLVSTIYPIRRRFVSMPTIIAHEFVLLDLRFCYCPPIWTDLWTIRRVQSSRLPGIFSDECDENDPFLWKFLKKNRCLIGCLLPEDSNPTAV